jgi:MFS family permease
MISVPSVRLINASFSLTVPGADIQAFFHYSTPNNMARPDDDKPLHRQRLNSHTLFVLLMLGLGSISYGYNASIIGTTLGKSQPQHQLSYLELTANPGQPSFISYMKLDTLSNGTDLESTTNGLFQTGGVIGTLLLPWVADKWGRRWACATCCIILIISGAIMTASVDIGMFIAFRFFSGAGTFAILAAVPLLMNEIVPVAIRGTLVDLHAVCLVLGYTIQGWVGFGFYFWKDGGSNTWRPPMALTMFFPLCLLIGLPFLPESPRWLCMNGRDAEAERVLIKLHSNDKDPEHDAAKLEFYQIRRQIEIDKTLGSSWMHIIRKPSYRKRASLAMGTCGIIQCCGVLVIVRLLSPNFPPTNQYNELSYAPID